MAQPIEPPAQTGGKVTYIVVQDGVRLHIPAGHPSNIDLDMPHVAARTRPPEFDAVWEPRDGVDPYFTFASKRAAIARNPGITPDGCLLEIALTPGGRDVGLKPSRGSVICAMTSGSRVLDTRPNIARIVVERISESGAVDVTLTIWRPR